MGKKLVSFRIDSGLIDKIGREENKSKLVNDLLKKHVYKIKENDKEDLSFLKDWERKLDEGKEKFEVLDEEFKNIKIQIENLNISIKNLINNNRNNIFESGLTDEDKSLIQNLFQDSKKYFKTIQDSYRDFQKEENIKLWIFLGAIIAVYVLFKFL
ncbi:MAG: hypothetical protein ACYDDB_04075 [bacterium]